MKWINCGYKFPEDWNEKIIRVIGTKELITEEKALTAADNDFIMEDGRIIPFKKCEWLDETDESPSSDPAEVLVVALKEIASPISRLTKKEIKYLADEGLKSYEQLKQQ